MGSLLSMPARKRRAGDEDDITCQNEARKRQKMSSGYSDENPRLISNLPDEISFQILARLPRICYLNVKCVSRSWKAAITSTEVYKLREELGTTEEWLYVLEKVEGAKLLWHGLDPKSARWQRLPPMPSPACKDNSNRGLSGFHIWNVIGSTIKIADIVKSWFGRRDALDRLPFCGCAVGAASGCLYIIGGFCKTSATQCVSKYDPRINAWCEVNSMSTGRAYCKTGLLHDKLYVVGGVNRGRGGLTPLQSAEVFDPSTGIWTPISSMPFAKAQLLPTAFLADMLKPIATGMTTYGGKLCVPQSLYSWPFFVDVGGEIYDPETDSWVEMPTGMGEGWPARQAGTKLSVVVDGELYALDPSSSLDNGKIKVYNSQEDSWEVVIQKVPVRDFTDSESPYLLAGILGKLHVITKDANNSTTVLQADLPKTVSVSSATPSSSASSTVGSVDSSMDTEKELMVGSSNDDMESDMWKVVASKNFGTSELVSCQVLRV